MDFLITDIKAAATILATLFAIGSLLITIIIIFFPKVHPTGIKLLGSLMVLALAFASNSSWVYALAIFITATLVTELDFLEKLAAIFWNREKYWEYRIKKATDIEVQAKYSSEIQEEGQVTIEDANPEQVENELEVDLGTQQSRVAVKPAIQASTTEELITEKQYELKPERLEEKQQEIKPIRDRSREIVRAAEPMIPAYVFEKAVFDAFSQGKGPFSSSGKISTNMKLISKQMGTRIFDAIIETPTTDYLIEIKSMNRPSGIRNAFDKLMTDVSYYRAFINERGIVKNVIPILIVPDSLNAPTIYQNQLPILKFNIENSTFSNIYIFLIQIENLSKMQY